MHIKDFIKLISSGFDVSFNDDDVFYTISLIKDDKEGRIYGTGGDNGFKADFDSVDSIPLFKLGGKTIESIIEATPEDEIYY